ncbi:protein of unknown function [Flexibacter flexilis DSM 6793]|uniref:Uncharacterized protein n=1 Tax=Flexibacter flexilis DSM 6793 TaxID=927664 RepID=A0A1I1DCM7_9BACT|nr:DUF3859 domain-containing protein [Flexibacter flexilis]SFB72597.1 protein of unknown function [Flexibacter flexilis DSM 6793]
MDKQTIENELINSYLEAENAKKLNLDFKEKKAIFNNYYDQLVEIEPSLTPAKVANFISDQLKAEYGKIYFLVFNMRLESITLPLNEVLLTVDIRKAGTFQKPDVDNLMPDDMHIIDPSGKVEADVEVYFGVAFVVTNLTKQPITIEYRLEYPPMTNPDTGKTNTGSSEKIKFDPGATEKGHYYYFLDEWEMVEGAWEFSYTAPNGMRLSKIFDVKKNILSKKIEAKTDLPKQEPHQRKSFYYLEMIAEPGGMSEVFEMVSGSAENIKNMITSRIKTAMGFYALLSYGQTILIHKYIDGVRTNSIDAHQFLKVNIPNKLSASFSEDNKPVILDIDGKPIDKSSLVDFLFDYVAFDESTETVFWGDWESKLGALTGDIASSQEEIYFDGNILTADTVNEFNSGESYSIEEFMEICKKPV